MEDDFVNSAIDMITPVMEGAMVAGAHYAKACNRNTVTAEDVKYGMRYCARHLAGKHIGTMFPELQAEGSDDEDDDDVSDCSIEEVDEDEEPFTRYSGNDEVLNKMNEAYDTWDEWVPYSPLEMMLKSAIDKSG
jgi:hypothetical protein